MINAKRYKQFPQTIRKWFYDVWERWVGTYYTKIAPAPWQYQNLSKQLKVIRNHKIIGESAGLTQCMLPYLYRPDLPTSSDRIQTRESVYCTLPYHTSLRYSIFKNVYYAVVAQK